MWGHHAHRILKFDSRVFMPESVSSSILVNHFISDMGITLDINSNVESWESISGFLEPVRPVDVLTQPMIIRRPNYQLNAVNGFPAVCFDGTQYLFQLNPGSDATPEGEPCWNVFVVGSLNVPTMGGGQAFISYTDIASTALEAFTLEAEFGAQTVTFRASSELGSLLSAQQTSAGIVAGEFGIFEASVELPRPGDEMIVGRNEVNGALGGLPGDMLKGGSSLRIGSARDTRLKMLQGKIAEILVFNSSLSERQRLQVYTYLSCRYKIPVCL